MLRAIFVSITILLFSLEHALAEAPSGLAANAALKYWQAFAQLPKFTDAEQTKLVSDSLTMPLDAHTKEIVAKSEYAFKMMHYGAALPDCAWGYGWEEDGVEIRLPNCIAARTLAALACLRARLLFDEGRNAEAIDDIIATLTMARHCTLDCSLIAVLVGYTIEQRLGELIAIHLPNLNADAIKKLKTRLEAVPAGSSPSVSMLQSEQKTLDWFVRKVKETKDEASLLAFLKLFDMFEANNPNPGEKARTFLKECGGTADGILQFAAQSRPSYDVLAKKLMLPLDQFDREFKAESEKQASNPVYKIFFPALEKVRRAQAQADVRHALLWAAIAVQLDGREALKDHPDPVIGGLFEYVGFEHGFELRSKFKGKDGKPLVLTVGRRG
jgi:hypothetical protein